MSADTIAVVCYCARCDYFVKTGVKANAVGTHGCIQCGDFMEVYIAQGSKEVVTMHSPQRQTPITPIPSASESER